MTKTMNHQELTALISRLLESYDLAIFSNAIAKGFEKGSNPSDAVHHVLSASESHITVCTHSDTVGKVEVFKEVLEDSTLSITCEYSDNEEMQAIFDDVEA